MKTIIYAHPDKNSFCNSILQKVIQKLNDKNYDYKIINLIEEKFNPVFSYEDHLVYKKKEVLKDDQVLKYQKILKESEELIFIFPIYWFQTPAIVKGFLDRVFTEDFAFGQSWLDNIKKVTFITTAALETKEEIANDFGNPIDVNLFGVLKYCGINNNFWLHFGGIGHGEKDKGFYDNILKEVYKKI
ncbi:NAD(P)H-dependent oxidoreductase [Spiroplasma tabanidicola]|uniref:NAD(P)H dehydrogenase n=1 Tax=Spiroplasma tabanidicola TaxID=324079 RepID=A0A6I6C6K5_9MOLU|nr:NAD(P)H-dependent oxidoreductase [Spiroplasma tabanidicola]QGS51810.1 NAD(P)H dehydrogenase [Spiroplasma tabanidicola]